MLTLIQNIACGFLSYSQYSLLVGPRYLINPRFHLDGSAVSGLIYIAPGAGFLAGSLIGGRYADNTVKKWIEKRRMRLPQDRLNSGIYAFFVIIPVAYTIYGWALEKEVGGLAVLVISITFTAFGIMAAFNSLNTYSAGMCDFLVEQSCLLTSHRSIPCTKDRSHDYEILHPICFWSYCKCDFPPSPA